VRAKAPAILLAIVVADLFGGNSGAYVVGSESAYDAPALAKAVGPGARVLTPFGGREDRWPALGRLRGSWEWLRRTLAPSWNVPLHIGNPGAYVSLPEARWARLFNAVSDGPSIAHLGLVGFDHMVVPGDPRLAERAGVFGPPDVAGMDPELPAWVVRIPHRPRAYLAAAVRSVGPEEAFQYAVAGGTPGEVVVESPVPAGWRPGAGSARIVEDTPGSTRIEVQAAEPALLVLNDAWAPGWSATVDGTSAEVLRANWVVRAVTVPTGSHRVEFRYHTPGLRVGWFVALLGWTLLGAWAVAARRGVLTPPPTPWPDPTAAPR
jgi:hypothetical protein